MLADAFFEGVVKMKSALTYFTKVERMLLFSSVILVVLSFCIFDREN